MFKKKKENIPKLILAGIGAIVAVGGLIVGLSKLKKRKYLEEGCGEECCYCHHEEECGCDEEKIECVDEEIEAPKETPLLAEEEIKVLTK